MQMRSASCSAVMAERDAPDLARRVFNDISSKTTELQHRFGSFAQSNIRAQTQSGNGENEKEAGKIGAGMLCISTCEDDCVAVRFKMMSL